MKRIFYLFLLTLIAACNTTKESGYLNTSSLERPPENLDSSRIYEREKENKDLSSEPKLGKGLSSDVYLIEGNNAEMKIKRNFNEAWILLGKAIRINDLKVIKKNKEQGSYIVSYQTSGLLGVFSLFGNGSQSTYSIKLANEGEETKVVVKLVDDDENIDTGNLKDGVPEYNYDSSSNVIRLIYETLRNDI
jgi:uncharacterized lipoprotein